MVTKIIYPILCSILVAFLILLVFPTIYNNIYPQIVLVLSKINIDNIAWIISIICISYLIKWINDRIV